MAPKLNYYTNQIFTGSNYFSNVTITAGTWNSKVLYTRITDYSVFIPIGATFDSTDGYSRPCPYAIREVRYSSSTGWYVYFSITYNETVTLNTARLDYYAA